MPERAFLPTCRQVCTGHCCTRCRAWPPQAHVPATVHWVLLGHVRQAAHVGPQGEGQHARTICDMGSTRGPRRRRLPAMAAAADLRIWRCSSWMPTWPSASVRNLRSVRAAARARRAGVNATCWLHVGTVVGGGCRGSQPPPAAGPQSLSVRREVAQALAFTSADRGAAAGASGRSLRHLAGGRAGRTGCSPGPRQTCAACALCTPARTLRAGGPASCGPGSCRVRRAWPRLCGGGLDRNSARKRSARDMSMGAGHTDACTSRSIPSKALKSSFAWPGAAPQRRVGGGPAHRVDSTAALPPSLNSTLATSSALSLPGYMPLVMFSCASSSATLPAPACAARSARVCLQGPVGGARG